MSALQCDVSTPFNLCGVNTFFNPSTEFESCQERLLLIGQMTDGSAIPNMPVQVVSNEDDLFGVGSMAASMVKAARCEAQFADVWVLPLADFGTTGSAEVVFSGAAGLTVAETVSLVVNGEVYTIAVAPSDTDAMIAAAFELAIDDPSLTITASGATLTIETINGGEVGGWLDVRTSYSVLGISDPATVGAAVTLAPGVGVPPLAASLASLGSAPYTFIASPYADLVSMTALKDYICTTWTPRVRTRAESYTVIDGDIAGAQALATSMNAPQVKLGYLPGSLSPVYEATAAFAMAGYQQMNTCNDPLVLSNPVCGLALECLRAPEPADRLGLNDADQVTGDGIGLLGVNAAGEVEITSFPSTYTTTDQGVADGAFSDGQNVARLRYIANYVESRIQAVYGRHTVRRDGYTPRAGQRVATVWQIRDFVRALGFDLSDDNIIEDPDAWSEMTMVEWDGGNSCVNISVSPDLVNKLCCINLFINSRL